MPKFVVTGKTLFDPIELEIRGKIYTVPPMSYQKIEKIDKMDAEVKSGSIKAMYEQVKLFLPKLNKTILYSLNVEEIQEIRSIVSDNVFNVKDKEQKKEPRPGEEKLP